MSEALTSIDKSLSIIVDGVTEKGTQLVEFLYAQAPEVISQLLLYHGVESAIKCVAGFILLVIPLFVMLKLSKMYYKYWEAQDDTDHPGLWVPMIGGNTITFVVTQVNGWDLVNLTWLKIWIAPKIYLLEYLAGLTK